MNKNVDYILTGVLHGFLIGGICALIYGFFGLHNELFISIQSFPKVNAPFTDPVTALNFILQGVIAGVLFNVFCPFFRNTSFQNKT